MEQGSQYSFPCLILCMWPNGLQQGLLFRGTKWWGYGTRLLMITTINIDWGVLFLAIHILYIWLKPNYWHLLKSYWYWWWWWFQQSGEGGMGTYQTIHWWLEIVSRLRITTPGLHVRTLDLHMSSSRGFLLLNVLWQWVYNSESVVPSYNLYILRKCFHHFKAAIVQLESRQR